MGWSDRCGMLDGVFRHRRSTRSNLSGRCSRVVVVVRSGCSVLVAAVVLWGWYAVVR